MRIPAVFPIVLLNLFCISVSAQEFGGYPASTKWRHRSNDSIDILFTPSLERKAAAIEVLIKRIPASLPSPHTVRKLPIVLQQRTTLSNGYVGMGPYRSEFQLTPLQNSFRLGSLPWYSLLALHEYRHVQQYDYFNRGISRVAFKLLGQEAGALLNSVAIPNWFWEGDAVWQETSLSTPGRGRIPYFLNDLRTVVRSHKRYSYMKWRNGSYRDLLPDHYPFGFLLINYGHERFGSEVWKKTTAEASAFKPVLYPFQGAFRRATGISFRQFVLDALQHYESQERDRADSLSEWAGKQDHFVSNNEFPAWINAHTLLYVSASYRNVPAFYTYDVQTKQKRRVTTRRISLDNQFSYNNSRFVYAGYQADRRWSWSNYSVLVVHDMLNHTERQVSTKTKYFSPDIDSSGTRIVAVHIDSSGNSQLHEVEANNGKMLTLLSNPLNFFITYPKYRDNDHVIAAVRNEAGEMGIAEWTLSTGESKLLLPFSDRIIGYPQVYKSKILFTATDANKESAFVLDGDTIQKLDVDSITQTGVYQPSFNGNMVALSAISVVGSQLITVPTNKFRSQSLQEWLRQPRSGGYALKISGQQLPIPDTNDLRSAGISRPYHKSSHLINIHSLRPYVSDPNYSLTLVSENVLNDFRAEMSVLFNRNERYKQVGAFATYAGLFPWIRGGVDFTFDRFQYFNGNRLTWNEWQPRIGILIPLDFTQGYRYRSLQASLDYVYTKQVISGIYKDTLQGINFGYVNPSISWTSRSQQAKQHIYPKFAQSITLDYRDAVHGASIRQVLASGAFYFPGLSINHSLVIQAAAQYRNEGNYQFSNSFPFSRGYTVINYKKMERIGINYHLPLVYPDAGVAQIVYLLRIRANPFFDITRTVDENKNQEWFRTVGSEVFFDTKWWNQQAVSFGIRYSRLIDADPFGGAASRWEFILPVNLIRR